MGGRLLAARLTTAPRSVRPAELPRPQTARRARPAGRDDAVVGAVVGDPVDPRKSGSRSPGRPRPRGRRRSRARCGSPAAAEVVGGGDPGPSGIVASAASTSGIRSCACQRSRCSRSPASYRGTRTAVRTTTSTETGTSSRRGSRPTVSIIAATTTAPARRRTGSRWSQKEARSERKRQPERGSTATRSGDPRARKAVGHEQRRHGPALVGSSRSSVGQASDGLPGANASL